MDATQVDFSLWCDFIERNFLDTDFLNLIEQDAILGATSNPSIFASAILKSNAYKNQIKSLQGKKAKEIYEILAITDIKKAADALFPLWKNNKNNGYISIEIDPFLGDDVAKSIDEGKRLFKTIDAKNVMIKVPATQAGYEVMEELYKNNIPINATLIFSPQQAKTCADIFKSCKKNATCNDNRAVISVFVSRFDRAIDPLLQETSELKGKVGILNAMECYMLIEENQDPLTRTLFASTGVKSSELSKDYYINELLLNHSINTAPLESIHAYLQAKTHKLQTCMALQDIKKRMHKLKDYSIDIASFYHSLMQEGLKLFMQSFEQLLQQVSQPMQKL